MKRLGIYVMYDGENIADDYIGYMLGELREAVDCLVVICNCKWISRGMENISPYADKIYYRDNIGLDVGAYRYALCYGLGWDEILAYEELVLLNDSFYGPLYPIENLFHKMEKVDADYWGLTRSPEGVLEGKYVYDTHIQSYFLVFRESVLCDKRFREFWEKMPCPESFFQAVRLYELECNKLLSECGWRGIALSDLCELKFPVKANDNPYMVCPYELIHDARVPVLKRKSLDIRFQGFSNALRAFKYIEAQGIYDVGLIKKHLMRIGQPMHEQASLDFSKLNEFYHTHTRIFLYGAGTCGKNLAEYFDYRGWSFEGFLVTALNGQREKCILFDEADIADDDGIIITVGTEEAYMAIKDTIAKRCNRNQIYP